MNNGSELSAEIIKANPNIVRIAWYSDYGNPARPAFSLIDLDSVIARFSRSGIVSVINLMDVTCANDYAAFNNRIAAWWVQPKVVALIKKHQGMVIANIANEFGQVNWAGNPANALQAWKDNYRNTITAMRNAGIRVPIMIDAPDCGTSIDRLVSSGAEFQNHDPFHNVILSAHAYWGLDDSAAVANKVTLAGNQTFPIVLGEVANFQTDAQPCQYNIKLTSILRASQQHNVGWMAWCWYKDHCPDRQMTTNGNAGSLSAYGQTIVNHPDWGLATKAIKTTYQKNGGFCNSSGIPAIGKAYEVVKWKQPLRQLLFLEQGSFTMFDITGRVVMSGICDSNEVYTIAASIPSGVYSVRFIAADGDTQIIKIFAE